jgi:hypothetical protein
MENESKRELRKLNVITAKVTDGITRIVDA